MSFLFMLFLAVAATPANSSPTPAPAPTASAAPTDPCGQDGRTSVLSTINRPTIGYSPCAVKPHESLAEIGYQYGHGDVDAAQIGQGFLRFGVVPEIEVDVIGPAYQIQSSPQRAHGFADSGVGVKWEFAHNQSTALGTDVLLTAPTGDAAFTAGVPTQTINVDASTSSGKFGFASTVGVMHSSQYSSLVPSLVVSNQWTDRAQWYGEVFAQTKTSASGKALLGLDGGIQYLLTPQIEIDGEVGRTISDTARVQYFGFGFGLRF